MKKCFTLLLQGLAMLAFASYATAALADIHIEKARARAANIAFHSSAIYLDITNDSDQDDVLLSVASPYATTTMLHDTVANNGIHHMHEVSRLAIPAYQTVHLTEGGLHIMLIGLREDLVSHKYFPLKLTFEKAGLIETQVKVE